jgi:hypothetical protein
VAALVITCADSVRYDHRKVLRFAQDDENPYAMALPREVVIQHEHVQRRPAAAVVAPRTAAATMPQ